MYYEIHGDGQALLRLDGGGSTISSNFGAIFPELSKTHKVIAIDLQAHGRKKDIDHLLSFELDADDVGHALLLSRYLPNTRLLIVPPGHVDQIGWIS
jgi:hypothetical protein